MSWYDKHPMDLDTIVVRGHLADVQRTEKSHDFITTTGQRFAYGAATIAGAAAGSMAAPGLVTMAGDNYEKAEWVTFTIDEQHFEGWLMQLPMADGDEVEVIARKLLDGKFEVLAVRHLSNGIISIYPHVTRGKIAHKKQTVKVTIGSWLLICIVGIAAMVFLNKDGEISLGPFLLLLTLGEGLTLCLFGALAYRAARRFRPFVQIAEHVFRQFGWKDVESIDLRRSSWRLRGKNPPDKLGVTYFRYKEE